MLLVSRYVSGLGRFIGDCPCKNLIHRTNLRLCYVRTTIFVRRYAEVFSKLKVDDSGKVKVILDPKVEAVRDKLIYSDYIERKRLRFGYGVNRAIEKAFLYRLKLQDESELMNTPVYSVALKYLKNEDKSIEKEEPTENNNEGEIVQTHKPIHMPYAVTDKFKTIEMSSEPPSPPPEVPVLNEQYKKLYETYLEAKKARTTNSRRKFKTLETRINEMEMRRPRDKLDNIPPDWMTDYEQYNDAKEDYSWETNYGTPNPKVPVSLVPCGGCGAILQCQDSAIPGYLPSELFLGLNKTDLKNTICQRCHFMKFYNTTLEVTVSPDEYPEILSKIQLNKRKVAVILMIDVTDFPCSIWPNLTDVIGKYTPVFVVGNKIDLLPKDSTQFFQNIEKALIKALDECGIRKINIKNVNLISAKTGYGVERLINTLHKLWQYKGDVYMIGCTNVGKSTLFNALIQSDYCKMEAVDLIQRATTSPWPGTTLNLLKFPILNPVRWRLKLRARRRQTERLDEQAELLFRKRELTVLRDVKLATLQERIGRTFTRVPPENVAAAAAHQERASRGKFGIDETDPLYAAGRWCYDTPGVIHPDQVLHLLTTEELLLTLPKQIISPRTFIFKPGQTMFLAGLGRLDLLEGPEFIRITVFASNELPVTICPTIDADYLYDELLQSQAFAVPINDPERLKIWPKLEGKEFYVTGAFGDESAADILLSSAGWVALTPEWDKEITVKAWTPEGRGIYMRTPALLSKSVTHRGARMKGSAAYRLGRQVLTK